MHKIPTSKEKPIAFFSRVGEESVTKVFTFLNADGSPHDITAYDFRYILKQKPGNPLNVFELSVGDGLEVTGDDFNKLELTISAENAAIRPMLYFGLLYAAGEDKTWLNVKHKFFDDNFDPGIEENPTITIFQNGDEITINITGSGNSGGLSTVVTDNLTIEGDGSESLPVKIKDGYLGSAALVDTQDLPISDATQAALDLKADSADLGTAAASNVEDFDSAGAADAALGLANSYTDQSVITTFEGLSDVPAYTGNAGRLPNINAAENAVEFGKGYAPESSFNSVMTFDNYPSKDIGTYNLSSGDLSLTVAGSGNLLHAQIIFKVVADGTHSITFSGAGWDSNARFNIASGDVLTSGTYWVWMMYGKDGVQVSVPGNAKVNNGNMANMATKTYKGRTSVGTGSPEDVPAATVLTDIGGVPTSRTVNGMALTANRSIPVPGNYRRTGNSRGVSNNIANAAAGGTQSCAANSMRAFPWFVSEPITFIEILSEVTTAQAATNYRLGIYTDNNGYPDALVAGTDAVEYSGSAAAAVRTSGAVSITLTPGKYWIVINSNGNPTLRSWPATILPTVGVLSTIGAAPSIWGWTVTSTYGAMPSTFPAGASANTTLNCPIVVFIM